MNYLNNIKTDDQEIIELIETMKLNPLMETAFLYDGRIYTFPFLYSKLNEEQRINLDVTNQCELHCIVESLEQTDKFYFIDAFVYMDKISLFQFDDIEYYIDKSIEVTKLKKHEFINDTNGISTMINTGIKIKIPKDFAGEVRLQLNYQGLEKTAYVCEIDENVSFDFSKTNVKIDDDFYKLIKIQIISFRKFVFKSYMNLYHNVPDFKLTTERSIGNFRFYSRTRRTGKEIKINRIFKIRHLNMFLPRMRFYIFSNNKKQGFDYRATIGDVYRKEGFSIVNNDLVHDFFEGSKIHSIIKKKMIKIINYFKTTQENIAKNDNVIKKCTEFEKEHDMLNRSFIKTLPWQVGRFFIIVGIDNIFNNDKPMFAGKREQQNRRTLSHAGAMLKNISNEKYIPHVNQKKDVRYIVDNLRKSILNDEYIDPSSYFFIQDLIKNKDSELIVCDDDYIFEHLADEEYRRYLDGYSIFQLFCKFKHFKLPSKTMKDMKEISNELNDLLGIDTRLVSSLKNWTVKYIINYTYTFHLFNEVRPNSAYVVGPYRPWIFEVANFFDIPSYEFQYAAIENEHVAYSFKRDEKLKPETMIVWSDFWKEELEKYNDFEYIQYPNKYFHIHAKEYDFSKENEEYDVLFLSQNAIGTEMIEFAYQFALKNPSISVLYRFHPHEDIKLYKIAQKCKELENFTFTGFDVENIYSSVSKSKFIVGVYSTTTIEALALGKPVALLHMPGIHYMQSFIDKLDSINVYENIDELLDAYNNCSNMKKTADLAEILFG